MRMPRAQLSLLAVLAAGAITAACGDDDSTRDSVSASSDPGPLHVHGLGVNPRDGALFLATHTGLFRSAAGERTSTRIGERMQDTMGFTVVGPDRFLGSGHPDGRDGLPPFLGLIESRDAGATWKPVSLLGERDFHVLEASGGRIYGFGSDFATREASLLTSRDAGRSWQRRTPPEPLLSLAIDPDDPDRIVASGERGLHISSDAGRRWRSVAGEPALLSWSAPGGERAAGRLYAVDLVGGVRRSDDAAGSWRAVGQIGGEPAAFEATGPTELHAALHDGTIKRSTDGGVSWSVRSTP